MFRIQGFFIASPIFSNATIPFQIKIGLSAMFCFWFYETIYERATSLIETNIYQLTLGIFHELFIGFIFGVMVNLIFDAISTSAYILGSQVGQNSAEMFDPGTQVNNNAVSSLYGIIAMVSFLSFDGLHHVAFIIKKSFELIPLASFSFDMEVFAHNYVVIFNEIFVMGLKFILPIIALMFIVDVFIALFSKIMPQVSMYFLLNPSKIMLLGIVLTLVSGAFSFHLHEYFETELYTFFDRLFVGS